MADSTVGDLDQAATTLSGLDGADTINDGDLFLVEQNGQGKHLSGAQMRSFVDRHVLSYDGEIVASDEAGGAVYNSTTQELTLKIPHGAGIAEVTKDRTEMVDGRRVDYYKLKTQDVYTTDEIVEGEWLDEEIPVINGKDGVGTVNYVMGIAPGGEKPEVIDETLNIPKSVLMDYIHPVGSVYISSRYFSPAVQFSGTWVRLMNRFLYASGPGAVTGAGNAVGTLDGSATHTLKRNQLPNVNIPVGDITHGGSGALANEFGMWRSNASTGTGGWYLGVRNGTGVPDQDVVTAPLGSGAEINHMPPYRTYHAWERVGDTHVYGTNSDHGYFTDGAYIALNTQTINMLSYSISASASTCVIAVSPGDTFTLTGTGASSARLWAFIGADGTTRKRVAGSGAVETGLVLTAGADEAFLIVNVQNSETFSLVGGTASE